VKITRRFRSRAHRAAAQPDRVKGNYDIGAHTRSRNYRGYSPSAEWREATPEKRRQIREACRGLDRSSSIFQAILNRGVENIIGLGPQLTPTTDDPGWNKAAKLIYLERGKRENFSREALKSRWESAQLVWRSKERDGGVAIHHPFNGTQLFEDGQILTPRGMRNNPRVRDGVAFDRNGAFSHLYVGPYSQFGTVEDSKAIRLNAWHIDESMNVKLPLTSYFYNTGFVSGYRGVSAMASALDHMQRLDEYLEALLDRAVNEACVLGTLHSDDPTASDGMNVGRDGDDGNSDPERVYDRASFIESGVVWNLAKDDEFKLHHTTTPNQMAGSFIKLIARLSSVSRGQPTEISLLDFSETNFSASKAAIEQAKRFWLMEQMHLNEGWWRPDYDWCIYEAIKAGALPYRDDWRSMKISNPGWASLDPKNDAMTSEISLRTGEANLTSTLAKRGKSLVEHLEETAAEYQIAEEVSKRTGVPIDKLIHYGTVSLTGGQNHKEEPEEDGKN